MALIGIEGFDHITAGDTNVFDSGSSSNPSFTRTSRFGAGAGQAWRASSGTPRWFWDIGSNQAHLFQGVACEFTGTPSTAILFELYDSATIQCWLAIDGANRRIQVYRGSGTGNLLGSSASNTLAPMAANNWNYIEWEVTLSNTVGVIKAWVDNVEVLNITALDNCATANEFATRVCLSNFSTFAIDDYYAFDDTGSECNSRPGPCRIYTGYPTSDASVQFTPSSGTDNFAMVDEASGQDEDTTYNSGATAGHKDFFGTNLNVPSGATVLCAEVRSTLRKDDVGARDGRALSKSGSTTTNGATLALGNSYVQGRIKHATNPDGGVAWTDTTVNALQPGYECVT